MWLKTDFIYIYSMAMGNLRFVYNHQRDRDHTMYYVMNRVENLVNSDMAYTTSQQDSWTTSPNVML